jgi:hypothetical protein
MYKQICCLILIGCALAILVEYERVPPTVTGTAYSVVQYVDVPLRAPWGRFWLLSGS